MDRSAWKILIVDDSDFSRKHLKNLLNSERIEVSHEASNAKEALEIVSQNQIDIAIIDVVMPEISGIELTRTLKNKYKDLSVIMMSSLSHENIILDAISAGAQDFLQKPINKDFLLNSIERLLEQNIRG